MKNLILITLFCFTSSLVSAQDFGKTLLSGSIGYSSSNDQSSNSIEIKSNQFQISPKYGVFVTPNLVIGALAAYTSQSMDYPQSSYDGTNFQFWTYERRNNSFSVGPFARLYHPISQHFAFFGQGLATFNYGKEKFSQALPSPSESSYKGGNISLSPGVVFFPSNTIGVELSLGNLGYNYQKSNNDSEYNSFNLGFGLSTATVGISLYLGRIGAE